MSKVFFYKYDPIKFERSFPNYIMKIFLFGDIEIRLKNYETMSTIDNLLWRMPETSFLPHEIISDNLTSTPIILSLSKINNKKFNSLVVLEGASIDLNEIKEYERVAIFFEKNNTYQLESSRKLWKEIKSNDFPKKFFEQKDYNWVEIN